MVFTRAGDIAANPTLWPVNFHSCRGPEAGTIPMPGIIPKLSGTLAESESTGPAIGQLQRRDIRRLAGPIEAELNALRENDII